MKKENTIVLSLLVIMVATLYSTFAPIIKHEEVKIGNSSGLPACTVTQSVKTIGNQASTQILARGARSWAIIQQPQSATNTVALSMDNASSTMARGYILVPNTGSDTASSTDKIALGFTTDFPTSNAVEAITGTGSTTIKIIECR